MVLTAKRRVAATALTVIIGASACGAAIDETGIAASSATTDPAATTIVAIDDETGTDASSATAGQTAAAAAVTDDEVLASAAELRNSLSSSTASDFVQAVAANGSERWVPWLLDLLRLDPSLQVSAAISDTLGDITGLTPQSRIPDMINFGSWSTTRGLDGGDGYRNFKVDLYARIDERFGPLLDSVVDQTELAAIQWGGVPVGGIPELNDPERVPAAEADWMTDDEVVLAVSVGDETVAYPLRILARHELANDTVGGEPIAVVYCTLCRSAIVYDRTVDGAVVQFLTSGLLSNSNKIMLDVETQTLWSHLRGVGIGGELVGTDLVVRSVNHLRWSDFRALHPEGHVLTLPAPIFFPGEPERPPIAYDYSPGAAYASYYENPDVWFPIIDTPDVWPLKTEVIGIAVGDDSLAISVESLNATGGTITVEVGDEPFTITPTGVSAIVTDAEGTQVIVEQSFWFAWFANHPETRTLTDP